jgi:hypothetical protein
MSELSAWGAKARLLRRPCSCKPWRCVDLSNRDFSSVYLCEDLTFRSISRPSSVLVAAKLIMMGACGRANWQHGSASGAGKRLACSHSCCLHPIPWQPRVHGSQQEPCLAAANVPYGGSFALRDPCQATHKRTYFPTIGPLAAAQVESPCCMFPRRAQRCLLRLVRKSFWMC